MPRYKLRTLLIVLAIGPIVLAASWTKYLAWKAECERKSQRLPWMVSVFNPPESYAQLPQTVGEYEAQKNVMYVGLGPFEDSK